MFFSYPDILNYFSILFHVIFSAMHPLHISKLAENQVAQAAEKSEISERIPLLVVLFGRGRT